MLIVIVAKRRKIPETNRLSDDINATVLVFLCFSGRNLSYIRENRITEITNFPTDTIPPPEIKSPIAEINAHM